MPSEFLTALGVNRVVFPASEYRSERAGVGRHRARNCLYETARLLPHGEDGGFAEKFLLARRNRRHTDDT